MGKIGREIGSIGGEELTKYFTHKAFGNKNPELQRKIQNIGKEIGSDFLGHIIPFKKGGLVKPSKGKTQPAILHKNELVVPASMVKNVPQSLKKRIAKNGGHNMVNFC